jgi:hypothetical protein
MTENQGLLSSGWDKVSHNKRYIIWLYLLNLALAFCGAAAFETSAHAILDHALISDRMVHGFDVAVMAEMLAKPEFGKMSSMTAPSMYFAILFFVATALFLPGIFQGYASTYRLQRGEFFRACGQNLWRFIRLMLVAGAVMGIVSGILFAIQGAIVKKAGDSTSEMLPFQLQMMGLAIIFLIMTVVRIWFDLAEADTVLNDQRAVRKSIAAGFRHTFRGLGSLLGSYLVTTVVAAIILAGGLWFWMRFVPAASVAGAWLVSQLMLLLLLIPRFWQRGVAVAYWQRKMLVPVVVEPVILPAPEAVEVEPVSEPMIPNIPPTPQES